MKECRMVPDDSLAQPLVISMGDACGIGPEIIASLWRRERPNDAVIVSWPIEAGACFPREDA